jgi:hypothetical protein
MSPILGIIASSRLVASTAYQSIATVTVGGGGAADVTFSSIPSTFTHLQIRAFAQTNRGTFGRDEVKVQVGNGSIDTGSNYSWHMLYGDGTTASAPNAGVSNSFGKLAEVGTGVGSAFGAIVFDILDYTNINKYKTIRSLGGGDHNGLIATYGGSIAVYSTLWQSTSAINTIKVFPVNGTQFNQYSSFALYGIKS